MVALGPVEGADALVSLAFADIRTANDLQPKSRIVEDYESDEKKQTDEKDAPRPLDDLEAVKGIAWDRGDELLEAQG